MLSLNYLSISRCVYHEVAFLVDVQCTFLGRQRTQLPCIYVLLRCVSSEGIAKAVSLTSAFTRSQSAFTILRVYGICNRSWSLLLVVVPLGLVNSITFMVRSHTGHFGKHKIAHHHWGPIDPKCFEKFHPGRAAHRLHRAHDSSARWV